MLKPGFSLELQSMRGIAALVVLFGHCFSVFSSENASFLGLRMLLNGGAAVAFFFTLSGTVLALSICKKPFSFEGYRDFLIRRAFRILPVLLVTATVGTLYCNHVDRRATYPFATSWFTELYKLDIDLPRYVASLVGYSARPAAPLWSVFVELIASALIPFMWLAVQRSWLRVVVGCTLMAWSFAGAAGFQYSWPVFLINFYVGTTLLLWARPWADWLGRQAAVFTPLCISFLVLILLTNRLVRPASHHGDPLTNLVELVASALLIALAIEAKGYFTWLHRRAIAHLGDISYSVYLLHFPIMALTLQVIAGLFPWSTLSAYPGTFSVILAVSTTISTLMAAHFSYHLIELPMIALGRNVMPQRPLVKTA
jgi:peptidoglycan/LPS O-acetylase OafA/YrhL